MLNLNLKKKETLFQNTEADALSLFYASSTRKSNKEFHFARVDKNFCAFLPYLTEGAAKLYLYYAFSAKNETGESWHSVETISRIWGRQSGVSETGTAFWRSWD